MKSIALALLLFFLPSILLAQNTYEITNVKVIDGDTITCDIHLDFDIVLANQTVRALGYDAWETSKRRQSVNVTDEEVKRGKVAKNALLLFLTINQPNYVSVSEDGKYRDNYGRLLLYIRAGKDKTKAEEWMKERYHVRSEP